MNISPSRCGAVLMLAALAGCTTQPAIVDERDGVAFERLAHWVWLHTSYRDLPGIGPYPSNGVIVADDDSVTLVDTAWTNAQTETVLDWIETEVGLPVTRAVLTHAHADKMGGVGILRQRGIDTFAHRLSNDVAFSRDLVPAEFDLGFDDDNSVRLGSVQVYFPGPGHTADNVVVWHRRSKTLFGGCLIRPAGAKTLGNTGDAVVSEWATSVERAAGRFGNARLVIPSHGRPGGTELFDETVRLAREHDSP